MQLTTDQQQALSVAYLAWPNRFHPTDTKNRLLLDTLVAFGRLVKDGEGYKASDELVLGMAQLTAKQTEQAALN
jgi:hypothetical protein